MFVTMFAAMLGAGALGFTAISGQLLHMQKQIGELRTDMHKQIGELSERMARVETLIETRLVLETAAPPAAGS